MVVGLKLFASHFQRKRSLSLHKSAVLCSNINGFPALEGHCKFFLHLSQKIVKSLSNTMVSNQTKWAPPTKGLGWAVLEWPEQKRWESPRSAPTAAAFTGEAAVSWRKPEAPGDPWSPNTGERGLGGPGVRLSGVHSDDICILNRDQAHRRRPVTPVSIPSGDGSAASHPALVAAK